MIPLFLIIQLWLRIGWRGAWLFPSPCLHVGDGWREQCWPGRCESKSPSGRVPGRVQIHLILTFPPLFVLLPSSRIEARTLWPCDLMWPRGWQMITGQAEQKHKAAGPCRCLWATALIVTSLPLDFLLHQKKQPLNCFCEFVCWSQKQASLIEWQFLLSRCIWGGMKEVTTMARRSDRLWGVPRALTLVARTLLGSGHPQAQRVRKTASFWNERGKLNVDHPDHLQDKMVYKTRERIQAHAGGLKTLSWKLAHSLWENFRKIVTPVSWKLQEHF